MQRTLFFIPHEIAGIPVWGVGWALLVIIVAIVVYLGMAHRRGGSLAEEVKTNAVWWAIAIAVVVFVLPQIELRGVPVPPANVGQPLGLAVRGYGFMMLLGVVSAVALAVHRGKRRGVSAETILGLAPWLLISGIIGARAFYVIEYRQRFTEYGAGGSVDWGATIAHIFDFTSGGLVVYGAILGGLLGSLLYCSWQKLSVLRLGDVVMPCLFLGIFFGRLGCLLNGCCYGGRCEDAAWALYFPKGSPVYEEQLLSGDLVGVTLEGRIEETGVGKKRQEEPKSGEPSAIVHVASGSLADEAGLQAGQTVDWIRLQRPPLEQLDPTLPVEDTRALGVAMQVDGRRYYWAAEELPPRAEPVWPAQLISSLAALFLCLGLLAVSPFCRRDGMLVALGFAGYAVVRFGLETIRSDEPGQFGTGLTISQLVSICTFTGAIILLFVILRRQPQNAPSSGTGQPA